MIVFLPPHNAHAERNTTAYSNWRVYIIRWHSDLCADLGRRGPDRVDKIKLFNLPSNFQKIRLRPPSPDKKRLFFEDLPENNSDPHMLHVFLMFLKARKHFFYHNTCIVEPCFGIIRDSKKNLMPPSQSF